MELNTNYFLFVRGMNYDAKIPETIKDGTRIVISYKKDGEWVKRDFVVAGISVKGDLCRIHDRVPTQYDTFPGNTIYVKPCRYVASK